jgi:preprotein translocase subunit SecE
VISADMLTIVLVVTLVVALMILGVAFAMRRLG